MNILIVDDEQVQVESLRIGLRNKGYDIIGALNAREALERVNEGGVDIVVTDYSMPGANGLELMQNIRKDNVSLPVIMMTAYGEKDLVIKALRNHCDGFIEKPFTLKQLTEEIERIHSQSTKNTKIMKMGEAVYKTSMGHELHRAYDIQNVINSILQLSLEGISLDKLLEDAVNLVVSLPWLSPRSMGGIFLVEEDPETLVMKTKHWFPVSVQEKCACVSFGKCYCGQAASTQQIQFFKHGNKVNDSCDYLGLEGYCVPIVKEDTLYGVLNIYVGKDHTPDETEKEFLNSIARTLAGIIQWKKGEEEKEKIQAQLLHAQKMEAIGTLTSGIAHDFNNLLQIILGFTQLYLLDKKKDAPGYSELKEAERAAHRAKSLIQQLLMFGRRVEGKRSLLNLNYEIKQLQKLLARTIPRMISIDLSLSKDLKIVSADPNQIEQVLMNLAVNALHAMPDGGKLSIETKNITIGAKELKSYPEVAAGEYVIVRVTDTGHGMDKKTVKRIFEPFYTTKHSGEGTGLGLSVACGIIRKHEGYITCDSKPGVGTCFTLYLPVATGDKEPRYRREERVLMEGTETVLFVDDEEAVREVGKMILSTFGYTVLTAANGEEALKICKQKSTSIQLVILDVNMAGIGGMKCLEEILNIDYKARVIMTSGHTATNLLTQVTEAGAWSLLYKPFNLDQLLKVVREALDDPGK